jgi:hypothetical protein
MKWLAFVPILIWAAGMLVVFHVSEILSAFERLRDVVFPRSSIAKVMARGLLSPAAGADWSVRSIHDFKRIEAENEKLGVSAWGYAFSDEAHLFYGNKEIALEGWERRVLSRALKKRGDLARADAKRKLHAANENLAAEAAKQVIAAYAKDIGL